LTVNVFSRSLQRMDLLVFQTRDRKSLLIVVQFSAVICYGYAPAQIKRGPMAI